MFCCERTNLKVKFCGLKLRFKDHCLYKVLLRANIFKSKDDWVDLEVAPLYVVLSGGHAT